jgi:ATP-dependent Clp protease ATP-binding subunit ClpA
MVKRFNVSDDELEELIFKYCNDITKNAREGKYGPITGRDKEIRETIIILLQKGRKNVGLTAPAGVGKTALVVGLAQQIVSGNVPDYLKDARVIELDMARMAAGTTGPAEFQGRFIPLCKGFAERYSDRSYPRYILFMDEFHTIMPTMTGSAYAGLSEVLKPYLTAGDLHVIGATTEDEFRMYVAEDPAMERRFQRVPLKVPNHDETVSILKALRPGFEKHHQIEIPDDLLEKLTAWGIKRMPRRNNPDKSIIIMDGACALHVMEQGTGGELDEKYIREVIATEVKIHPDAI